MDELRRARRQPIIIKRDCAMNVITFKQLEWRDHVAHIIDMSTKGVGVISDDSIEPGFVWFKDRVGGYKSGVMRWSMRDGDKFRAGIKFIPLSKDEEQQVQKEVEQSGGWPSLRDPEVIIATLVESMKKGRS